MSDPSPTHAEHEEPAKAVDPFSPQELKVFTSDDQAAGRAICKMLSLFFFYTVIVMALSTYFTYRWVTGG